MWLFYILLALVLIVLAVYFWQNIRPGINTRRNLALLGQEAPMLTQDGIPTLAKLNQRVWMDVVQARGKFSVIQQPNVENKYTFFP